MTIDDANATDDGGDGQRYVADAVAAVLDARDRQHMLAGDEAAKRMVSSCEVQWVWRWAGWNSVGLLAEEPIG